MVPRSSLVRAACATRDPAECRLKDVRHRVPARLRLQIPRYPDGYPKGGANFIETLDPPRGKALGSPGVSRNGSTSMKEWTS